MRQRAYVARIPPLAIEPLFGFKCVTALQVFHGVEGREELPEESARLLGAGWGSPVACRTITYHISHVTYHMSHVTCHMSHVTCHMSHVTCHMSHVTQSYVTQSYVTQSYVTQSYVTQSYVT